MADVVRGERETRRLVEASGGNLRYFRHPFLHAGMSPEIQMATSEFLQSRGYTVAPVTIDNSEWIYGRAYAHAYNAGDEDLKERIGRDYIRYMLEVVTYYEAPERGHRRASDPADPAGPRLRLERRLAG